MIPRTVTFTHGVKVCFSNSMSVRPDVVGTKYMGTLNTACEKRARTAAESVIFSNVVGAAPEQSGHVSRFSPIRIVSPEIYLYRIYCQKMTCNLSKSKVILIINANIT